MLKRIIFRGSGSVPITYLSNKLMVWFFHLHHTHWCVIGEKNVHTFTRPHSYLHSTFYRLQTSKRRRYVTLAMRSLRFTSIRKHYCGGVLDDTYRSFRCRCHRRCCCRRRHRCSASLSKRMSQLKQFLYNSDNGSSFNCVHLNFRINSAIDLFCLWFFFGSLLLFVCSIKKTPIRRWPTHTHTHKHIVFRYNSIALAYDEIIANFQFQLQLKQWKQFTPSGFSILNWLLQFSLFIHTRNMRWQSLFSRSPSCKNFVVFRYRNISRSWCWHFLSLYIYAFAAERIRNNRSRDGY